ncbi:aminotransferase class V-fold PLP-dependent enzyme [Pseudomonas saudiphocaensis]|uniref:aminotransferase class V-fold PLP-dependent enzyme n=1 Tax=Pseudomonas saudiphocaensis TaxID=1499686 RepID=UPI00187D2385|nr:cysteine desulfurase [Pseudomonas saudiphocaensis]MBE7928698.1 aminotransferase class V-fold PLP-dependent enzyme [Pseudomonas saudiphocaensis]
MLCSPWRSDFPALAILEAQGQSYLDSAATAQKPQALIESLTGYYTSGTANVHRAQHQAAERATRAFENARLKVAHWLNARSPTEILFTHGATEALNLLAYGLEHLLQPDDEIVISALEHHANLLPWQQLAQRRGAKLVVLPLDKDGLIDLESASRLIGSRTRLLAVSQLSNVLGAWQPLTQLLSLAKTQGALTIVDGAQGVVHGRHDMQALACDFYVFSGHKLYGPEGVGVLYGRDESLLKLKHWQFGGEMVRIAEYQHAEFHAAPLGFEAGTPTIGAVIGLGATLDYLSRQDAIAVAAHEQKLHSQLLSGLSAYSGLRLLGKPSIALACFTIDGVHHGDLAHLLTEQGIAVRSGSHCAQPLMKTLGIDGAIRVSLGLYNDGDDLQRFFSAMDRALELLQ